MEKQKLLDSLEQLHEELSQADRVDPATLGELETLISDIRRALQARDAQPVQKVEPISGLKDLLLKYEADHPQLATAVGRVADALAGIGL
jgi:hypothetical protein